MVWIISRRIYFTSVNDLSFVYYRLEKYLDNNFNYCINFFRQALLLNYNASSLVYFDIKTKNFDLAKFAPFVHNNNILDISEALQDAIYHIERNGNSKIILTDLSIKLTRLLHAKQD